MTFLARVTAPIAGPSRTACAVRHLHNSTTSRAAVKKRPITPAGKTPSAARHPSLRAAPPEARAAESPHADRARTPPLTSAWPWRPTTNPRTGAMEEERTVFARPFEMGRPRMYWFGALASGLFLTTWLLNPPPARSLPPAEGETLVRPQRRLVTADRTGCRGNHLETYLCITHLEQRLERQR